MKRLFIISLFVFLTGCTHSITVKSNYVESNPNQFKSEKLSQQETCIVLTPELKNYIFEKKVYNWAGGSMFKDTLFFDLGKPISAEIDNLISNMFSKSYDASNIKDAIGKNGIIIKPEIIDSSLDLPSIRGGNIVAEIQVKYSFYDSDGKLIASRTVLGTGTKALVITKENYNIAFGEAISDLINKSKAAIENVDIQTDG